MEKRNEPLLLRPAGKDYLWGGKRLNDEYGKNIELSPLAETWECSTHPDGVSTVCCGTFDKMELTAVIKAHPEYLGERHKGETTLPILVKLIDARKDLSVQVHPDDDYAKMKGSAWKNGDVVCAGCSQGCKTDLRFAAGLHKERNAKGTGRRYGDEVSAEGTYSQG